MCTHGKSLRSEASERRVKKQLQPQYTHAKDCGQRLKAQKEYCSMNVTRCNQCLLGDSALTDVSCPTAPLCPLTRFGKI